MTILSCYPDTDFGRNHAPHRGISVRLPLSTEFRNVYSVDKRMDRVSAKRSRNRAQ